jgi:acetoacetate decarboxylase
MSYNIDGAGFSMPLGASLYGPPPYEFRDAEQVSVCFTADAQGLAALLPPGLEVADNPAQCEIRVCNYRWSTFGPFHESYALIRVRDSSGALYWYLPLIFTDNEAPLAAGREIWGYPKKLAMMTWSWGRSSDRVPSNELLHFDVERPRGSTLFSVTFMPERQADPAERHGFPVVSHRFLPPSQAGRLPAADELIMVSYPKTLQRDASGSVKLWAGKGSISIGTRSEIDPWFLFDPITITGGYWQVSDFALPAGSLLRNYIENPGDSSDEYPPSV